MRGIRKLFHPINQDFSWPHPKKVIFAQKKQNIDMILWRKPGLPWLLLLLLLLLLDFIEPAGAFSLKNVAVEAG